MKAKIVPLRSGLTEAQTRDVFYLYDNRGLQTGARFDATDGEGVTTWYDGFGRPITVLLYMSGQARYLGYVYHGDSLFRISHPDGSGFAFHYDGLGRMTHLFDNPAGSSLYDNVIGYHYRQDGQRHAAVRGSGLAGFTTVYYPDFVQRPGTILNDLPGTSNDMSVGLSYNPAGQIEQLTRHNDAYLWRGAVPVERDYAVNGQNQYTSTGTATLGYDANGNLSSDGSTTYVYDVENRLVSASGAKTASLLYDPLGRLWQTSGGAAGVTRFLYDGDKLVAEYDAEGALLRRYAHGPGTDEPVAVYEGPAMGVGSSRRYTLPDERGSIVALVNADGSPSVINTYDEYGVPGSEPQGRFGYTGQTWIPELGLWYYKARFYSSRLGRFLQVDPIGYEDQINLYAYVGNDPVNDTDDTGESRGRSRPVPPASGVLNQMIYARNVHNARAIWAGVSIRPTVRSSANPRYTVGDVQYSTGLVRTMGILGPSNFGGQARAQADPAGRGFQQALQGSSFNPTSTGIAQWNSTGGGVGQANAFYLMTGAYPSFNASGVARGSAAFGDGLNMSITAYRSSSNRDGNPPSISFVATQTIRPPGSLISVEQEVMRGKIRFD